ncbi:hypothetical protein L3Q82_020088, partial [Scortum barcoo]
GLAGDSGAFFALRSCHQLLHSDSGEFFSPDYLCSNPPLWCNWTIQVDPGKRIQLHLEDLTPDDACHLKQDQVHVDEPTGRFRGHRVLQKCWREAKYTSWSNTLHVVLLIGSQPSLPYRGFYGRYQVFGPPVLYNPQEGLTERRGKSEPPLGREFVVNDEQMESDLSEHPSAPNPDLYDFYDQPSAVTAELPWEPDEDPNNQAGENLRPASENDSYVSAVPTSRSGSSTAPPSSGLPDSAVHPLSPRQQRDSQNQLRAAARTPTTVRRNVEEALSHPEEAAAPEEEEEEVTSGPERAADQRPPPSVGPEPEQTHPHPNMVEPLSDHGVGLNIRNHSESPHLPGDHLFELAVEVKFRQGLEESWDQLANSLLLSVKALISEKLQALHTALSLSPKRIKRLSEGVLYILWLQIERGPGGPRVHESVHSALQGLIATNVGVRGDHERAVVISMSTADVNECGTQLVLCDMNADCVNHYGSYSCRCRPGFLDRSRLGSGGTVCVDVQAAGCHSGLSAETKGVYVLFFLLSSLMLMLLVAAGMLYHRHHRGAFLVRCHSKSSLSPLDSNNSHHHHDDSELPPPPPPSRGFRAGWPPVKERCPAVDLPLLRFSPLLPADVFVEPQEGAKM